MRISTYFPLFNLLVLAACSRGLAPGNRPADFAVDSYSVAGERIQPPSPQNTDIYHEVLKFYKPSGGRMRLLDRTLLPATSEQVQEGRLDEVLAESMLARLGNSFCVSDGRQACNGRTRGGVVRVSPVYRLPDERVRVAVRYTSIEPNAPGLTSTQVFLLEQSEGKWVIRGRQ
jgi:hypothetical protein